MRYAGLLLAVLLLVAGCTRKEELLLLEQESVLMDEEAGRVEDLPSGEETLSSQDSSAVFAEADPDGELQTETDVSENPGVIYVHVCGAVLQPGVYELRAGSRVYEAVQAAGGFAEGADQNYVNQAQELGDGIKLVIPTVEEAEAVRQTEHSAETVQENAVNAGTGDTTGAAAQIGIVGDTSFAGTKDTGQAKDSDGRININTASEAQLCDIPGIGATRAAAIAAYRESNGRFQKPEDIMKVNGIKEGVYEKIKDSISVN